MKKMLLSAAIAAACTVPGAAMAETTLYGNFRWSVIDLDTGAPTGSTLQAVNNASRLGVKGAIGEGGLKGIYHLQMGANNDGDGSGAGNADEALTDRFYFAGLKGGFGSIIYGRHSTGYKMAGVKQDPFYDTSVGPANGGSNYGYSPATNGFTNNSLAYTSPKIGGAFTINAGIYLDDSDEQDYVIGGQYSKGGITAGIQYYQTNDVGSVIAATGNDESGLRVYGGYKSKMWSAAINYEQIDTLATQANGDDTYLHVNGTFNVTPKTKLAAAYGKVEDAVAGAGRSGNGDGFSLGVFQKVLSKTTIYGMYSSVDYDSAGDRDVIGLGVIQSF